MSEWSTSIAQPTALGTTERWRQLPHLNDRAILKWNDGKAVRTVPIDAQNVFTFDTAPGYQRSALSCVQASYIPSVHDHTPDTIPCENEASRGGTL
jgi:hypothetical protein